MIRPLQSICGLHWPLQPLHTATEAASDNGRFFPCHHKITRSHGQSQADVEKSYIPTPALKQKKPRGCRGYVCSNPSIHTCIPLHFPSEINQIWKCVALRCVGHVKKCQRSAGETVQFQPKWPQSAEDRRQHSHPWVGQNEIWSVNLKGG